MKIDFEYKRAKDNVYVWIGSEKLGISNFIVFDYNDFYKRYVFPQDSEKLKEDMVDTLINIMSIPYTKEELMEKMNLGINSDLIKYAKS